MLISHNNPAVDTDLKFIQSHNLPITLEQLSNTVESIQYFRAKCLGMLSGTFYVFHIHPTDQYPNEKPQIFLASPQIAFNSTFHEFQYPYSCAAPISFLSDAQWTPNMKIGDIYEHLQQWVEKYEQTIQGSQ